MSYDSIAPEKFNSDYLTVYQLLPEKAPANKRAWVNGDGAIETSPGSPLNDAIARTVHVPDPAAFVSLLTFVGQRADLVLGNHYAPGTEDGEKYRVLSGAELTRLRRAEGMPTDAAHRYTGWQDIGGQRYLQRLKENQRQSTWMLLDKDVDDSWPRALLDGSESDWLDALDQLLPGVSAAALVAVPSAKQRILLNGQPLSQNWHYWVQVVDAADIPRAESTILPRGTVVGMALSKVASGGKVLQRTIVDTSALKPNRLAYDGRPVVKGEGLRVIEVPPRLINPAGGRLDTAATASLSDEEVALCAAFDLHVSQGPGGTAKVTSAGELTDETVIETKAGLLTVAEYAESAHGKLRCQVPEALTGRRSTSWNGILNRTKDGTPTFFDNGTGVRYVRRMDAKAMFEDLDPDERDDDEAPVAEGAPAPGPLGESIRAALRRPEPFLSIVASKGGGKTVELCRDAVERAIAGECCVIATQALTTCKEIVDNLQRFLQDAGERVRIVKAFGGDFADDDDEVALGRSPSSRVTKDVFDAPVIVVVTHALLGRRGVEASYFKLHHRLLNDNPLPVNLFIDEADEFLEARGEFIQLDSRLYKQSEQHRFDVSACKAQQHGISACDKCTLVKNTLSAGRSASGYLRHRNQTGDGWVDQNFAPMPLLLGPDWGVSLGEQDEESVYRRTALEVSPMSKDMEIKLTLAEAGEIRPERLAAFALRRRLSDWLNPAVWTHQKYRAEGGWVFPGLICEGRYLAGSDLGPLKWLRRLVSKGVRVRLLTGTWDPAHGAMLQGAGLPSEPVTAYVDAPKMREVLIVTRAAKMRRQGLWRLVREVKGRHQVLNFIARKTHLTSNALHPPADIFQKRYLNREYHVDNARTQDEHDILTTHVRSALGRGVNLPEYDVVVVQADATQPAATVLSASTRIVDYFEAVADRAARILDQAVFRVMRTRANDDARRVIVLHDLPAGASDRDRALRARILNRIRKEVQARSESVHEVKAPTDLAVAEYARAFLEDRLPPQSVTLSVAALSEPDRKEARAAIQESKKADTARKLMKKTVRTAARLRRDGQSARKIARATNWSRVFPNTAVDDLPFLEEALRDGFRDERKLRLPPVAWLYAEFS